MALKLLATLLVISMVAAFGCSDDPAEPTPDPDPKCELSMTSLNHGDVAVGDMNERSFTIKNIGGGTLVDTVSIAGTDFTMTAGGGAFALSAGQSRTLTVKFMPTALGLRTATLSFASSSCGPVSAMGTGVPLSITLNPSKDNTLYESPTGQWSNGAGQYLFAGRAGSQATFFLRRALLHFDIAGNIPASATIDSVHLQINVSRTRDQTSSNLSLHGLSQDWGEGASDAELEEGGGADPQTGDATWLHTFFNTAMWTTAGGDFGAEIASIAVTGDATYKFTTSAAMVAEVQSWLDNANSNFGWIVLGDESGAMTATAKRFDSRENPVAANRPMLTVYYTP